jgi:hypothetical protein
MWERVRHGPAPDAIFARSCCEGGFCSVLIHRAIQNNSVAALVVSWLGCPIATGMELVLLTQLPFHYDLEYFLTMATAIGPLTLVTILVVWVYRRTKLHSL